MTIDPRLNRIVAAQPYPLLFATISGAHLYGFPSPDSDFDLRGVHVLPLEMVVGIRERIDYSGNVVCPLDLDDTRAKIQQLVDRGAQGFVVVLLWSHVNPSHETAVRELIEKCYPDVHLVGLPVFCSSEVAPTWHEYPRGITTLLHFDCHDQS